MNHECDFSFDDVLSVYERMSAIKDDFLNGGEDFEADIEVFEKEFSCISYAVYDFAKFNINDIFKAFKISQSGNELEMTEIHGNIVNIICDAVSNRFDTERGYMIICKPELTLIVNSLEYLLSDMSKDRVLQ